MASALKHETSTLRQRYNFFSIDLTFGVVDNVREVTSPATFGSDSMSGETPSGGTYSSPVTELQPIPVNQVSCTIAQKTRSGVRKTLLEMRNV